ncbi:MAG TPA: hypothetical protein VLF94_08905 [Chlamydiales bacterium]|nr:hypothetical protein [Chlamydiales bacterium]
MRLIFDYQMLKKPMYRIAIDTHCAIFTADRFAVMCDGEKRTVNVNKSSLIKRLNVSKRLYKQALASNDLMRLILPFLFRRDSDTLGEYMKQMEGDLHLSKEDYKNLAKSVDISKETGTTIPIQLSPIPSRPESTEVSRSSGRNKPMSPASVTRLRVRARKALKTLNKFTIQEG